MGSIPIIYCALIGLGSAATTHFEPPQLIDYKKDYCAIKCNGEKHVMCEYKGPSKSCRTEKLTYDRGNAQIMLRLLNEFRNEWASGLIGNYTVRPASNMRLMKWDQGLARMAHRWVMQCVFGHDKCRDTEEYAVGQNVAFLHGRSSVGDDFVFERVLYIWLREMNNFDHERISRFYDRSNTISNLSQLVWHNTDKVGCSYAKYLTPNLVYAFVCNYAPKGNIEGEAIYEIGPPTSKCPQGTKSALGFGYEFLCGSRNDMNFLEDFDPDFGGSGVLNAKVPSILLLALLTSLTRTHLNV